MDEGEPVDPMIGRVLAARYRIEEMLGQGAMGAVYRARHVKVGRPFAVKVLHERLLADPKQRKRFEREAELAGKLHHVNVIGVIDVGETEDGVHFMVMEFAEGTTLGGLVDGPMQPARVIRIAQQLLDGLQHAHEHGLVHRDFKPDNVMIETDRFGNERPRILDFGIAILREDAIDPDKKDRLTTAGLVLGTPHYMAPEQATGHALDHRIDLFALGVILYELVTGALPFEGDGVDVARANLIAPTPPMGVRVPGLIADPLLEAFTRQLMEKSADDRPESAKAARHLLDVIERDRPMAARILGVTLAEAPAPAPAPPADEQLPYRATMASAPISAPLPEEPSRVLPTSDAMSAESLALVPTRRSWPFVAFLGVAVAIAAVVVVIATRSSSTPAEPTPAVAATEVIDAAIDAPPPLDAAPAIDAPLPPPVDAAAASVPTPPPLPPKPVVKPTPKPPKPAPVPAVVDTSATAVATLYGQVGRELKALDTKRGPEIAQPLWARFRQLRINDALATPEKRIAAERLLSQLRKDIAKAM